LLVAAAVFVCTLPACGAGFAASVDGHRITASTLQREINTLTANSKYVDFIQGMQGSIGPRAFSADALPTLRANVLTIQITAIVVKEEFDRRRIAITPRDRAVGLSEAESFVGTAVTLKSFPRWYQRELTDRAVTRAALRRVLRGNETPVRYYRAHPEEFTTVCARDIVVFTYAEAWNARQRILGGASFADVARQVSRDSRAGPNGGDLGCRNRDRLPPELYQAGVAQTIGQVGMPIKRPEGYHLVMVESRNVPQFPEVEFLAIQSVEALEKSRLEALLAEHFAKARVAVDQKYGAWDGQEVALTAANFTPKPHPLPPVAKSSKDIRNPEFNVGQEVFLTDQGFVPRFLTAVVDVDISFINETSKTQVIRFDEFGWKPARIKPGGKAKYRAEGAWRISFHLESNPKIWARIQAERYDDPRDDLGGSN